MRRALCVFLALVALVAYSQQAYSISDVRQIASTSTFYTDGLNPTNIYYHTDGTKYVIGSFKGSFIFNAVTYTAGTSSADMYILKYNADGSPAFAKVIPVHATTDTLAKTLKGAVAPDGSFYLTAKDNAAFTLDSTSIPASNGVLVKLGADGVLQWYRTVTGIGLFGVRVLSDNSIAVFGGGSAAATWKDQTGATLFVSPYTNTGFYDMIYYRFTSAGAKMWEYRRQQVASTVTPAPAPTNQFIGKDDSIYSAIVRKETVSSYSVYLEKITAATGAFAWSVKLQAASTTIDINGVTTDANGNVYVTSTFQGNLNIYQASGASAGTVLQSALYPAVFAGMFNSTGSLQWKRNIIDSAKATAAGISYNNGALALVGYLSSTIQWNDGAGPFIVINKTSSTTYTDGYILLLDATTGNMTQAQGVASNASDYMISVRASGYGFDMYAFMQGPVNLGGVQVTPVSNAAVGALFHFEDMTCHKFNTPVFGSPKPIVTAALTPGNSQSITISVTMYRQSLGNSPTPVYFNLDSKDDGSATCRGSTDNIVGSAGVNWAVSTDGCSATYTITQTLSQIVDTLAGNNKWVASLASDGRSIVYSLPIYATYSVNDGDCYFAGYKSVVTFRTALSVASTSASFVTADGAAKFTFSGLRITTDNKLEVQGTIAPMIQNSEIRAITLSKPGGPTFTSSVSTCNVYNTGCAQTYTADVAAFGGAGTDISGPYNTVMDFYENGVLTRPGSVITYTLNYIIPSNPNVVDSDTITTAVTMYTDNTYGTVRTQSYSTSSGVLYVKNAVSNTSPTIPTGYRLRYDHGYLCCVNYLTTIPAYDPVSDTGGCRANGADKLEWVDLGTEGINTASVQHTASNTQTPKQYNLQVALAGVFSTMNHANPLTCEVLLLSKLDNTGGRKSMDANLNDVYVSTTQILVEAKAGAVSSAAKSSVAVAFALVAAVVALVL